MSNWQLQDAKAKFSELVRAAQRAPQTVTVRGEAAVVVLSQRQYKALSARAGQPRFTDFMRQSPLAGLELDVTRDKSLTRPELF